MRLRTVTLFLLGSLPLLPGVALPGTEGGPPLPPEAPIREPMGELMPSPGSGRGLCADIARGYTGFLETALAGVTDVDAPDPEDPARRPPLVCAAEAGQAGAVRLLLRKRANPEARGRGTFSDGRTALLAAAVEGHADVARLLLTAGAKTDARDGSGRTPLMWAAYGKDKRNEDGFAATVATLLDGGADPNAKGEKGETALLIAVGNRSEAAVRLLASRGANANLRDGEGNSALMLAAEAGETGMVEALVAAKARHDLKDRRGKTAWVRAAEKARRPVMDLLVRAGAKERYDLVDRDETFRSALCEGDLALARRMVERRGVRIASGEAPGKGAVALAARCGKVDSVRYLLDGGASANDAGEDGEPALVAALTYTAEDGADAASRTAAAALLVEKGADVGAKNGRGETALSRAVFRGDAATVRLLLSKGASPETTDEEGTPPLVLAARWGRTEAAKALLDGGASTAGRDRKGKTAWILAAERGDGPLLKMLEAKGAAAEYGAMAWAGNESALGEPLETAVTDGAAWSDLWRRAFGKDAPLVDFDRYFVACAFLGRNPGWWYSIGFLPPSEQGKELVVGYELAMLRMSSSPEAFRDPGFPGQYAMKVYPKREGLVPVVRCLRSEDGRCPGKGGVPDLPLLLEERGVEGLPRR
jgi:ankyrin repeat protein